MFLAGTGTRGFLGSLGLLGPNDFRDYPVIQESQLIRGDPLMAPRTYPRSRPTLHGGTNLAGNIKHKYHYHLTVKLQ